MKTKIDLKFEEDVYRKYYPLVYATCKRFLVEKAFLEDATQSVFLLYIKKEDSISSNLSSWFYWASVNICKVVNIDTKKHLEKSTSLNENAELTNEHQTQEEFFLDLGGILEKLPTKKRDMLMMRYYENKTYVEIGSFYKCHEDNIRKMIDRTILQLKNEVKRKEVFSSVVFAQFFGLNSASPVIPATKSFILQNSLLQQSFINGVQKMYLISKLKMAIVCVCLTIPAAIPLAVYLTADDDKPVAKEIKIAIKDVSVSIDTPTKDKQVAKEIREGIAVTPVGSEKPPIENQNKELLTPEVLAMTELTLKYLADHQESNGSWDDTQYKGNTGVTALGCLAFLSEGSRPRVGKYGKNLEKGLDFLIANVQANGVIAGNDSNPLGPMNEHVLSSMALLLSYKDMPWNPQIRDILSKSVQLLSNAQRIDGGWNYDFSQKGWSNLPMTANVLWFLRTSNKSGFTVSENPVNKGVQYLVKCAYPDGTFRFRYFGLTSLSMQGPGIIALYSGNNLLFDPSLKTQDIDWHFIFKHNSYIHPLVGPARDRIAYNYNRTTIEDFKNQPQVIYDCFYFSISMYSFGNDYWSPWFLKATQILKAMQKESGVFNDEFNNTICSTAMAAIVLQAPNGKLPLYELGFTPIKLNPDLKLDDKKALK